jgi:hypothetical protein
MVRFKLGRIVATPGAFEALRRNQQPKMSLLARHAIGDWGLVSPEDARANDRALIGGERILSAYQLRDGTRLWIITEADRSATTILLPDEY